MNACFGIHVPHLLKGSTRCSINQHTHNASSPNQTQFYKAFISGSTPAWRRFDKRFPYIGILNKVIKNQAIDGNPCAWLQHDPPSKAFSITVIASCARKSGGTRSRLNSALAYHFRTHHTKPLIFSLMIKTRTEHPHPFYSLLNPLKTHSDPSGSFIIHTVRVVTISCPLNFLASQFGMYTLSCKCIQHHFFPRLAIHKFNYCIRKH